MSQSPNMTLASIVAAGVNTPKSMAGRTLNRRWHLFGLWVLAALAAVILGGCAGLPQTFRQSLTVVVPHQVDFVELEYYAKRSRAAYTTESDIRSGFPNAHRITTVKSIDVLYFLETDRSEKTQTLTVRGTTNKPNIWQDATIRLVKDDRLEIPLHRGFRGDARAIHTDVKPYLKKDYSIRVTGHSLGGAAAVILAHYLNEEGYEVTRLVTFGGPKVTSSEGKALAQTDISFTRVVHDRDVVPMVPPIGFLSVPYGGYQHFGPEVILREGRQFVYLPEHDADRISIGDFWRDLTDFSLEEHHMKTYLSNIEIKVQEGAVQVPYFGLLTTSEAANQ
jgi:triacylglycerol lipase